MSLLDPVPNSLTNLPARVETNPHTQELPEGFDKLPESVKEYQKTQAQVLRKTHNQNQAGDSTFPWQILTQVSDTQEYTPGSLGRFFHESMGLILARYVKFDKMTGNPFFCVPVGRLVNEDQISWTVTNDLTKSSAFAAVGMIASLVHPTNGQFGWVIVSGPNLSSVRCRDESINIANGFSWSATGEVSSAAAGIILARKIVNQDRLTIEPGELHIELESYSPGALEAIFEPKFTAIDMQLNTITVRLNSLELNSGETDLSEIQGQITSLRRDLSAEAGYRIRRDDELAALIDGLVTQDQLSSAIDGLNDSIDIRFTAVTTTANSALTEATRANSRIDSIVMFDPTALETAIGLINTRITELAFTNLTDVPASYVGSGLKVLRVNAGETAVEFATIVGIPSGGTTGQVLRKNSNTDYDAAWYTLNATNIAFTPAGNISATDVAGALAELDSEKAVRVTPTVDNTVVRFDGVAGAQQTSGVVINDSNDITGANSFTIGTGLTGTQKIGVGIASGTWPAGTSNLLEITEVQDGTNSASRTAATISITCSGSAATPSALTGLSNFVFFTGSGTLNNAIGGVYSVRNTGAGTLTMGSALRVGNRLTSTGGIGTSIGFEVLSPVRSGSGVITTHYGILLRAQTVTGITNPFAIYQIGASDISTFEGIFQIGARLEPLVSGTPTFGSTTKQWGSAFFTSGAVLNFSNGNATLTHSSGLITSNVPVAVPDLAYDATTWDGSMQVPTRNAIRDKIESLVFGVIGVAAYSTDADTTLTWNTSKRVLRLTGTITADRALTLSGGVEGARFLIVRTGAGAFAWNVGTGPLKALGVNTWCEVQHDGTNWFLASYGSL